MASTIIFPTPTQLLNVGSAAGNLTAATNLQDVNNAIANVGGGSAGANTQIQYNNGTSGFAASPALTFNQASNTLTISGTIDIVNGSITAGVIGNSATYLQGDGSNITGLPAAYGNANVELLLASGTVSTSIITTAGVSSNGVSSTADISTTGNVLAGANVTATGNVLGANVVAIYLHGDGSNITGLGATYTDANVEALLASGNVTTDIITGGNVVATGNVDGNFVNATTQVITGAISTTGANGNISGAYGVFAQYFIGDGSNLTNVNVTSAASFAVSGPLTANTLNVSSDTLVGGNLTVAGNVNFTGNISNISGNTGTFFGNAVTGFGALYAGIPSGYTVVPQAGLQVTSNYDGYAVINAQNINGGTQASTDISLTNDIGNADTQGFADFGIASSTWDGSQPNSLGNIVNPSDAYLYTNVQGPGGNLVLGTMGNVTDAVKFVVGGPSTANAAGFITNNSVAIGHLAGNIAGGNTVSIGTQAGSVGQQPETVAIGNAAGKNNQSFYSVAIGSGAGNTSQGSFAVAMGWLAGGTTQGSGTVAIGVGAGEINQSNGGSGAVAVGSFAGQDNQGANSVMIGSGAGRLSSANNSIFINATGNNTTTTNAGFYVAPVRNDNGNVTNAIYYNAATNEITYSSTGGTSNTQVATYLATTYTNQVGNAQAGTVAIGVGAGNATQQQYSIAIGSQAGFSGQGSGGAGNSIAIGTNAGLTSQGSQSIAIGGNAAIQSQSTRAVAIGQNAAQFAQALGAIAIGASAGGGGQNGGGAIAIGLQAGGGNSINGQNGGVGSGQSIDAIAIGSAAGAFNQGSYAIAIGYATANSAQGTNSIAIGSYAGNTTQSTNAVAIGLQAGLTTQGANAVAIGSATASTNQGANAVAIGSASASSNQGANAVAIGNNAGSSAQGAGAVAIGNNAGNASQGSLSVSIGSNAQAKVGPAIAIGSTANSLGNSIAVGSFANTSGFDNSIVLTAKGTPFSIANAGVYITSVTQSNSAPNTQYTMYYNPSSSQVTYSEATAGADSGYAAVKGTTVSMDNIIVRVNASSGNPEITTASGTDNLTWSGYAVNGAFTNSFRSVNNAGANVTAGTYTSLGAQSIQNASDSVQINLGDNTSQNMYRILFFATSGTTVSITIERLI